MPLTLSDVEFRNRYGTAALWASTNPTPAAGELCFESDTRRSKLGDGSTAYNSLPYLGVDGIRIVKGAVGTHTGNATRTSKYTTTIPAGAMGANGALDVLIGARITSAGVLTVPAGPWLVELELGGSVIAQFQSLDSVQLLKRTFVQNQNNAAVQVSQSDSARAHTINTAIDRTLELFVTLDAADTALTLDVFSLEVNVR